MLLRENFNQAICCNVMGFTILAKELTYKPIQKGETIIIRTHK